jgi:hypothetical protein
LDRLEIVFLIVAFVCFAFAGAVIAAYTLVGRLVVSHLSDGFGDHVLIKRSRDRTAST